MWDEFDKSNDKTKTTRREKKETDWSIYSFLGWETFSFLSFFFIIIISSCNYIRELRWQMTSHSFCFSPPTLACQHFSFFFWCQKSTTNRRRNLIFKGQNISLHLLDLFACDHSTWDLSIVYNATFSFFLFFLSLSSSCFYPFGYSRHHYASQRRTHQKRRRREKRQ